ncbi:MAG: hypothetical protein KDG57_21540 [Rhodoferax sp.]|nr:hypothetical protein [Rhodoferax sp.]
MGLVIAFKRTVSEPVPERYARPPLRWIKRRARRIERFYKVTRRLAIHDAWLDYIDFVGHRDAHLLEAPLHA